jgi:MFS transporter, DHA1 family, tetracycline resistance protein
VSLQRDVSNTYGRAAAKPAAMLFIAVTVLIDMISIGLIVPVLPSLVGQFTSSPQQQSWWYGAIGIVFATASFFGAPVLGALSDRFGRRPVLLLGFCGLAVNFFITALASALWMLVLSRLIGGGMQANAAVANAYVADITPPEERARRFGILGAMFGLGFILGPALGGVLGEIDLRLPFFAAGALALANLAYGYFVLPESLPTDRRRPFAWGRANPLASLRQLMRLRGVGLLVVVLACSAVAQFTLYMSWVLYTTFKFGWGPAMNGGSLFVVGIVSAFVQGVLLPRLLKRFSVRTLALAGLASSTLAYALWGLSTQTWMMFAVIAANVFGQVTPAVMSSLISGAAEADEQGTTMGAVSALNSAAAVVGPMIGPPLLAMVSHLPRGDWRIGAPLFACAALQGAAWFFAWLHFRRVQRGALPMAAAS